MPGPPVRSPRVRVRAVRRRALPLAPPLVRPPLRGAPALPGRGSSAAVVPAFRGPRRAPVRPRRVERPPVQGRGRGCSMPQRAGAEAPARRKKKPRSDSNPRPPALESGAFTTTPRVQMPRDFAFSLLAVRTEGSSIRGWSAVQAGAARGAGADWPKCLSPPGGSRHWKGSYWSALLLSVGGAALRSAPWPLA